MTPLTSTHWKLVAAFMAAAAIQIGGLSTWAEAVKPLFVSGLLAQLAILMGGIYSDKP